VIIDVSFSSHNLNFAGGGFAATFVTAADGSASFNVVGAQEGNCTITAVDDSDDSEKDTLTEIITAQQVG
jgi:hypothetical protein